MITILLTCRQAYGCIEGRGKQSPCRAFCGCALHIVLFQYLQISKCKANVAMHPGQLYQLRFCVVKGSSLTSSLCSEDEVSSRLELLLAAGATIRDGSAGSRQFLTGMHSF